MFFPPLPVPGLCPLSKHVRACDLCGGRTGPDLIDVGGFIGVVRRSCFIEWDRKQEIKELSLSLKSLPARYEGPQEGGDEEC